MLPNGRTVQQHVEWSLSDALILLTEASKEIRTRKRLSKAKRVQLWRNLAGVVSDVESVRLWLECGAPRGDGAA